MKKIYIIFVSIVLLSSCFPEDEMVLPHEPGELQVGNVFIGSDYLFQSFYDLDSNRETARNSNMDWDLGFESAGTGYRIILNSSRFMYAGNAGMTVFEDVTSEDGLVMRFDHSSGNPDSAAIRDWYIMEEDTVWSKEEVFVINLGIDDKANYMGFKKVQFNILQDGYEVRYADLDNQNEGTAFIQRNDSVNYICLSFDNGVVDIEPDRNSWSFRISRYTTMLKTDEGEDYPYLVFGALINPYRVVAGLDTIHPFADISLNDTSDIMLSNIQDVIGYEWKYYNFDAGVYTIVPEYSYVIRDRDGYYYKLRFIDFYNDTGEKGNPEFEFLAL